jgi:hypothetical protein
VLSIYRPYALSSAPELDRLARLADGLEMMRRERARARRWPPHDFHRRRLREDIRRASSALAQALLRHQAPFAHEGVVYSSDEACRLIRRRVQAGHRAARPASGIGTGRRWRFDGPTRGA